MKKKIAIVLTVIMMLSIFVVGIVQNGEVQAKNVQIGFEIPPFIEKENEFVISVIINSDVNLYSIDAYLSYDSNLLEFIPTDMVVTGSAGVLELKDSFEQETKSVRYEIVFKALDTGKAELAFKDVYLIDYADMEYIEIVPSKVDFDIAMNSNVASDAHLKELIVAPGELTEIFDPNKSSYEMYVDSEIERIGISAVPMKEDSVVESDLPETLELGQNEITITVTSLAGETKKYTIMVYRGNSFPVPEDER